MNFTDNLIENTIKDCFNDIFNKLECILKDKLLLIGLDLYDIEVKKRISLITRECEMNSYNLDVIDENNLGTPILFFEIKNEIDFKSNGKITININYI